MLSEFFMTADVANPPPIDFITRFFSDYWVVGLLLFFALPAAVFAALFVIIRKRSRRTSDGK